LVLGGLAWATAAAQAPSGPLPPKPGVPVQQAPPQKAPEIKVRVALVNTPVTVRDANGEMVHDLEKYDFRIFDNGVEQKITHFDLGGDPISLVVVVENSSRIEPLLPEVRKTGILFTQTVMGPTGEAAVVAVNDSVDRLAEFTNDTDKIERAIARMRMGTSGVRLYDGLATAVEMLTSRPMTATGEGRRRVIVALSEAVDTGSDAKLGMVLRQAQLANVTIYSVGLSSTRAALQGKPKQTTPQITPPGTFPLPPQPGTPQTPTTEAQRYGNIDLLALAVWAVKHGAQTVKDNSLEVAAAATGGVNYGTFKDRSIEQAIDRIGGELHAQYSLSYSPVGVEPTGYHEIKVQVLKPGLKVRARPGYYLAPPES
jgi:VWFA-related protein